MNNSRYNIQIIKLKGLTINFITVFSELSQNTIHLKCSLISKYIKLRSKILIFP